MRVCVFVSGESRADGVAGGWWLSKNNNHNNTTGFLFCCLHFCGRLFAFSASLVPDWDDNSRPRHIKKDGRDKDGARGQDKGLMGSS